MGRCIRALDAAATGTDAAQDWPERLKFAIEFMLADGFPTFVCWGPDFKVFYNDPALAIVGAYHPRLLGRPLSKEWPELWSSIQPLIDRAMIARKGVSEANLPLPRHREDESMSSSFSVGCAPFDNADGAIGGVIVTAVDLGVVKLDRRQEEALRAQFQHGVRNILATIRSVTRRSAEQAGTVEDYAQHLDGRIGAIARTQSLLTIRSDAKIDLAGLILEELAAQTARERQYRIDGPDVALIPKIAEVLTLAVHELATNSTKFGALAAPTGRVSIAWRVEADDDGEEWLKLAWTETGSQPAPRVRSTGFGTELLTRRIPYELRGRGELELRPQGVHAKIEVPLSVGDARVSLIDRVSEPRSTKDRA